MVIWYFYAVHLHLKRFLNTAAMRWHEEDAQQYSHRKFLGINISSERGFAFQVEGPLNFILNTCSKHLFSCAGSSVDCFQRERVVFFCDLPKIHDRLRHKNPANIPVSYGVIVPHQPLPGSVQNTESAKISEYKPQEKKYRHKYIFYKYRFLLLWFNQITITLWN